MNDTQKNTVLDLVKDLISILEHKFDNLTSEEIFFYFRVLILKISLPNITINAKILKETASQIESRKNNVRVYPDPIVRNLDILTDLYRKGHIQKEEIESYVVQFKGFSEYFDLVFNSKELELTDIKLISYLTDVEVEEIMKSSSLKEHIYSLLDEKLLEKQSRVINEIFEKLYSKKFN
ncbi:hypothetical protein HFP65_23780 [Bacillus sp. CB62A.1]